MIPPRTLCVKCKTQMVCAKNGLRIIIRNDNEEIMRIWHSDKWRCPECGIEVIPESKFAQEPSYNASTDKKMQNDIPAKYEVDEETAEEYVERMKEADNIEVLEVCLNY